MLHEPLYKACLLALAFDLTAQVDLELQAGPSMHPGKLMLKAGVHAKILMMFTIPMRFGVACACSHYDDKSCAVHGASS